jgi:hypothetical protein
MDKVRKNRWDWVPLAMPGVTKLMADKKREMGADWVATCWANGMKGEPGWFFAKEGPLMVGTPWDMGHPAMQLVLQPVTPTQALLFIKEKGVSSGA